LPENRIDMEQGLVIQLRDGSRRAFKQSWQVFLPNPKEMRKIILFLFLSLLVVSAFAQESAGVFSFSRDIGNPKPTGSVSYDETSQTYTLKGAGYNIWGPRDEHHYAFNKLRGDFILTAGFAFEGVNENHRKTGWMVRASEEDNAVMCGAFLHGDGLTAMQWRERTGMAMESPFSGVQAPKRWYEIIQMERRGRKFIMRAAHRGEPLQVIASKTLESMPDEILAGVVCCSHAEDVTETAYVWNARIDKPVPDSYNPGKEGWLGCRMEIMNVFDSKRKVIYEKNGRFEAPNWMPEGDKLLFNMDGSLYTLPVSGGEPVKVNTGSAANLNNDHCISFDGKLLGISHNDGKGSNVFYLPIEGGEPVRITPEAPSYLHGWAPNNKEVVYVARRNGVLVYDIYRKNIKGSDEIKLTNNQKYEHADGCEYSPDGKYIYYNGSKNGGTMHIWRMKPNGSEKEQLTFDEYNDWFPHVSPDGKWILFISFEPDIELNSHPSYKRVMLRLMPTSGGAPKVVAYLYGGQGTINVNSWSPDSKHIAFVSNSGKNK
jgi:TolB protein